MTKVDYVTINSRQHEAENDPFTQRRYEQFAARLPAGAIDILDVGCSTGIGGAALKQQIPAVKLVAFDCVADRLDRLPAGIYDRNVCGFSTSVAMDDASLDAIVAGEFIEHVTYVDVMPTIFEFHRVLRPGGRLLMTTPNPDYVRLRLTRGTMLGGAHVSAHYPKQLAAMLAEAGFGPAEWCGSGRMSRVLGQRFPVLDAYGSYLIWADRRHS